MKQSATSPTEFTLGHNVESKEEVDQVIEQARKAGAQITVEPHDTFLGGYSGYFQDPDSHLWEVVKRLEAVGLLCLIIIFLKS